MKQIIEMLHVGGYSCVIVNGDIRTFTQRGVADLYELLKNEPTFLQGASVADKVVGKGAAALMILGGVKRLHTDVISKCAWELISKYNIEVSYGEIVPFIENRNKTGRCPLETRCINSQTAEEALPLIEEFIEAIRQSPTNK